MRYPYPLMNKFPWNEHFTCFCINKKRMICDIIHVLIRGKREIVLIIDRDCGIQN